MKRDDTPLGTPSSGDRYAFSLMLGGPLYQLYRRTRIAGDALELLHRRVLVLALLAWLQLLVLSAVEGHAWSGVRVPFLLDVEMHARLLVALPLLIVAELMIHQRMPGVVRQFFDRGIIGEESRQKFEAAIASALRLRNSRHIKPILRECCSRAVCMHALESILAPGFRSKSSMHFSRAISACSDSYSE